MTVDVYARDANGDHRGIPEFEQLEAVCRYSGIGEWRIVGVPFDQAHDLGLHNPGAGIDIVYQGDSILGGDWTRQERRRSTGVNQVDLIGKDDAVWLAGRLVHPQPASAAPPYSTTSHDVRTGSASTLMGQYVDVNAGPSAITPRRVPGLTIGPDPALGPTITARGRWQPLIDHLASIAGISESVYGIRLGWRLRNRVFEVFAPTDLSASVVFSLDTDALAEFTTTIEAPAADYVIVGGGGDGTARVIVEVQDSAEIVEWGRREMFRDRRDTADVTELQQTGGAELGDRGTRATIAATPIDTQGRLFITDYALGDLVTVVADDVSYVQPVSAVKLTINGAGVKVTPIVGPATVGLPLQPLQLQRTLDSLNQRLTGLEVQ